MGRNTQGVIMIRLSKQEKLIGIERVENLEADEAIWKTLRSPSSD